MNPYLKKILFVLMKINIAKYLMLYIAYNMHEYCANILHQGLYKIFVARDLFGICSGFSSPITHSKSA